MRFIREEYSLPYVVVQLYIEISLFSFYAVCSYHLDRMDPTASQKVTAKQINPVLPGIDNRSFSP
jgi:hypothetical protein